MKRFFYRVVNFIKIRIYAPLHHNFTKKEKHTLLYLGLHKGIGFNEMLKSHKICYGFEANPEFYIPLKKKYRFFKNVHIINAAVTDYNGVIKFNISSNDGASSSIGEFKKDWNDSIKIVNTIEVPAILLLDFLKDNDINFIDTYCSDIQGNDLNVLKTLSPFLKGRKIGSITCETSKDKYQNIYELGDNSESGFKELLEENYYLAAKGWGVLQDGDFTEVDKMWWEMDCKWNLKEINNT